MRFKRMMMCRPRAQHVLSAVTSGLIALIGLLLTGGLSTASIGNSGSETIRAALVAGNAEYDVDFEMPFNGSVAGLIVDGPAVNFYIPQTNTSLGTVTMDSVTGAFLYTPPDGYSGDDAFIYVADDTDGRSHQGTVTLHIAPGPTAVPTEEPTLVPTEEPTLVPTEEATVAPTEEPTFAPTAAPTATGSPTVVPTTPSGSGQAAITLVTVDGGEIPNSARVCVDDVCQGIEVTASAVSGTTLIFADLAPGTHQVTVTDAAPYLDAMGSLLVEANTNTSLTIQLEIALVPTEPSVATPVVTTVPTVTPQGGEGTTPVKSLPNTGSGDGSGPGGALMMLLASSLVVIVAAALGSWRTFRTR